MPGACRLLLVAASVVAYGNAMTQAAAPPATTASITVFVSLASLTTPPLLLAEPPWTSGTTNRLYWNAAPEATSYCLQWSRSSVFAEPTSSSGWVADLEHTATNLVNGDTYFYRVKCGNIARLESVWSNVTSSTQDAAPPMSAILPLPSRMIGPGIPLTWAGQDATSGSGLRDFTIFASTNDGPFAPILSDTTVIVPA